MKISTIIPIYNTCEYLEKCIDSIVNQSIGFDNIELILVNDGSTDDSEKIIKKYTKKYKNIKYIKQENSGQAAARNKGLTFATGEYVSFVDSDDWIDKDMYLKLYETGKKENYDIVVCNFILEYPNKLIKRNMQMVDNVVKNFILNNSAPSNLILKRNFLIKCHFKFPEGIIYEDLAAIPPLACITDKIIYVDKYLYYYVQRFSSTVNHHKFNKKILCMYDALDYFSNYFIKNKKYKKFYDEIEYVYIYNLILLAGGGFVKYKETKDELKKIKNIIETKFPNWRKNKYYSKEKLVNKIKINLLYFNCQKNFKFLVKLENILKRVRRIIK